MCGILVRGFFGVLLVGGAIADPSFQLNESIGRDWRNELVSFPVSGGVNPGANLIDDQGRQVPVQLTHTEPGDQLASFVVDLLPANGRRTYTLGTGDPVRRNLVREAGEFRILDGGAIAARVPAPQNVQFDPPRPLVSLPAPLIALQGSTGAWIGAGAMRGDLPVLSMQTEAIADGPVFAESRTTYLFSGGSYAMTVRVVYGQDAVFVDEYFDVPAAVANRAWFSFDMSPGLNPDRIAAEIRKWRERREDTETLLGSDYAIDFDEARRELSVTGTINWWPETAMRASFYRAGNPAGDLLTVMPVRTGSWRNPTPLHVMTDPSHAIRIDAPIFADADYGGVHLDSPYYTGKLEEGWPLTATRRKWLIQATTLGEAVPESGRSTVLEATRKFSSLPLDEVKDWVLDWPDDPGVSYPRLFVPQGQLAAIRERVRDYAPWKDKFGSSNPALAYLLTADTSLVNALVYDGEVSDDTPYCYERMGSLASLRHHVRICMDYGFLGEHWMTTAPNNNRPLHEMMKFDAAMSVPDLDPAARAEMRRLMAFLCYVVYDQDWNPTLAGFHRGNINMPPRQEHHLAVASCVLPDHPLADAWRARGVAEEDKMMNYMIRPGGAWRECPSYQVDAAMLPLIQAALPIRNSGGRDIFTDPRLKSSWNYLLSVCTPPDPRFGVRAIPPFGNGSWLRSSLWGWIAAATRETDPAFSGRMQWMWKEQGAETSYPFSPLVIEPEAPAPVPSLSSTAYPGFGAVLRSGFPDPHESWLAYHCGENVEHYNNGDQGSFMWYAKGAPIVVHFGSIYQPQFRGAWYFNRVNVNHREVKDGFVGGTEYWPGVDTHQYAGELIDFQRVGPVDYCVGRHHWEKQSLWPEDARTPMPHNQAPPEIDIAPHNWTRQIALVKSLHADGAEDTSGPVYLVLRDSLESPDPLPGEWNLWFNAERIETEGNRARVITPHGVTVDVYMAEPAEPNWMTRTESTDYVRFDGKPETYWNLRASQEPGGGFFTILYPHTADEPAPEFRTLPDGIGVEVRHSRGTDTVLFSKEPFDWSDDTRRIRGTAAIVREENGSKSVNLLAAGQVNDAKQPAVQTASN